MIKGITVGDLLFLFYTGGVGGLDFGSGSGPIFVEQPFCSGFEDSILDCTSRHQVGVHQCDHSSDVGIRCQGLLLLALLTKTLWLGLMRVANLCMQSSSLDLWSFCGSPL